ncbi:hypothetical protein [Hyphococcus luteus]|uniref:MerR family transcriptional regulator n=1 Tax=Hyphococcus luteus TaxID=2058213 RepID=A0A2S7K534_9PROT|nr:hypothetical protein [Marinicaulis flavus]PQA87627.1 hypothetical protein CW354_11160 [Marinicaulis flavus]
MDLDDICDIEAVSRRTLEAMTERIRASRSEEHFIYREAELDQIWRIIGARAEEKRRDSQARRDLAALQKAVHQAHDLIGLNPQPIAAAGVLRQALASFDGEIDL